MTTTPETTPAMAKTATSARQMTVTEMFEDLGGYEELVVAKKFGTAVTSLASDSPSQFTRAMIFVDRRRQGDSDQAAYKAAQDLKLGEVTSYFKEEPSDPEADESGKDD